MSHAKPLFLIALFLIVGGCASNQKQTAAADAFPARGVQPGVTTFTDASHGLRLTYPGGWERMEVEKDEAILVLSRGGDHEGTSTPPTVTVFAQPKQKDSEARDLAVLESDYIRKARGGVKEFQLLETADATLGGAPARRILYTGSMLALKVKVFNVIAVHNGRAYAMMYLADPKHYDAGAGDVQRMADSFEWTN
jgi:hypothetical protein